MTDTATREFTSVGVIGLGTMGAGIAEVFARNGYSVIGVEVSDAAVQRGREHLEHSTGRAVKREKMTQEAADELLFVTAQDFERELSQILSPREGGIAVAKTATPRVQPA